MSGCQQFTSMPSWNEREDFDQPKDLTTWYGGQVRNSKSNAT